MARLNLSELNNFVKNLYNTVKVDDLIEIHAERVKQFLIENLSKIGRYALKDYERFGTLKSWGKHEKNDMRPSHHSRADGWVSLTEEVPDLDHMTYGTGMLYVHGEMELPQWWEDLNDSDENRQAGDHMYDDEYFHVNYSGTDKYIYQRTKDDPPYKFWYEPETRSGSPAGDFNWGDQGWEFGYLWHDEPDVDPEVTVGTMKPKKGITASYSDQIAWYYDTVTWGLAGIHVEEKQADTPDGTNDQMIYHLDNERSHFPYRVVNAATPKSVVEMLDLFDDTENGLYDGEPPQMAKDIGTWPVLNGIKFVKQGKEGLANFISPIEDVPQSSSHKKSQLYKDAFFYRNGINVDDPSTYPPNQIPPEERQEYYVRWFEENPIPGRGLPLDAGDGDG